MSQVREVTRKINTRLITFTCMVHEGGPTIVTEQRYPGPLPRVCMACKESGRYQEYRHKRRAAQAREARKAQHKLEDNSPC